MAAFAHRVAAGQPVGTTADPRTPDQTHESRPHPPLAWWESSWGHLGLDAFLIGAFAFAGLRAPRRGSPTATRAIRIAAVAAVLAVIGTTVYLGYLSIDPMSGAGPVLGNRAVIWLGLQALALVGLGGTLISAVLELRGTKGWVRVSLPILAALLFGAWAWYWRLLAV